jgi:catechol 2,3-dioxygenase-like lactoylglutathione lyase family enzyme
MLTVRDVEATCDFYARVLGTEVEEFEGGRRALKFGRQKINLHQSGAEFGPKAGKPTSGSGDFCLITSVLLERVVEHVRLCGVESSKDPFRAPERPAGSNRSTSGTRTATSSRSPTTWGSVGE